MFGLFKKKLDDGKKTNLPELYDLDDKPLQVGDTVESLRYELGKSKIVLEDGQYYYESIATGKKVIWLKMVDAITEKQKVKKLET
ncbi:hypothetical protein QQ020_17160 [Fulvivirgaceae bacterium BMA12]|uniref:Uncharacterized protein n=1 Tax=Agaribacillus aureus TaxID=3051825 RepID=A0ABT8L9N5_9BACT|nr:hypothetical protein [Fulvivirgaceae bacterium BMA12]